MKQLFEKWFCKHVWKAHHRRETKIEYFDTKDNYNWYKIPLHKSIITEILICEKCGKIKKITY